MVAPVLNAISRGYSARTILNQLSQRFPKYANAIRTAEAAGYTADVILKHISERNGGNPDNTDKYLTEHEKTQRNDDRNKRKAAMQAVGALGTAGAVAAGAYGYAARNQAIQPSAVLPAQQGITHQPNQAFNGTTINITPTRQGQSPSNASRALVGRQPPMRLPPPSFRSNPPTSPRPNNPPTQGGGGQSFDGDTLERNVELVKNLKEDVRFSNMISGTGDVATAVAVLKKVIPKSKLDLITKAGGLENVVSDFANYLMREQQNNPPATRQNTSSPAVAPQQEMAAAIAQQQNLMQREAHEEPTQQVGPEIERQQETLPSRQDIRARTQEAAFAERPEIKRLVDSSFKDKEFSIPTYRLRGESKQDFENRRTINTAIKKAAQAIKEGKSFLDYPINKENIQAKGGYSTAEDVLRFMAGIPNVYDPLLDDEEKQELFDGLMESGQTSSEGLRPSQLGDQNVYGAQMTPNLVWNLLISLEPKLNKIERPPAVKGRKAPTDKMELGDFKRNLSHGVYGVLSGKNISPELADKIDKISSATSSVDAIVQAAHDGNFRQVQKELEKMSDDEYFLSLFTEEVEQMVAKYGVKGMSLPTSAADTRASNEIRTKMQKDQDSGNGNSNPQSNPRKAL